MASIHLLWNRITSYFTKGDELAMSDTTRACEEVSVSDFEEDIDSNICQVCNEYTPDQDFIEGDIMCKCCREILLGRDKQCDLYKEVKHISLFLRPFLIRCKQCEV